MYREEKGNWKKSEKDCKGQHSGLLQLFEITFAGIVFVWTLFGFAKRIIPFKDEKELQEQYRFRTLWGKVRHVPNGFSFYFEHTSRLCMVFGSCVSHEGLICAKLAAITEPVEEAGEAEKEEAATYLRNLILEKEVEIQPVAIDSESRVVALAWIGNICINQEMVSAGYALASWEGEIGSVAHCYFLAHAEEFARRRSNGVWDG